MNLDDIQLISKFVDKKSFIAMMMFIQASSAANLSFTRYSQSYPRIKEDPPNTVMQLLVDARFFCESCGWCALAVRRLRYEENPKIKKLLVDDKEFIDSLYEIRKLVNHTYNEDLAEVYRKGKYNKNLHQDKLAFNFSPVDDGISFRIGTLEVNMISQLASIQKLRQDILAAV